MTVTVWRDSVQAVRPAPAVDVLLSQWLDRPAHLVRFPEAVLRPCDPAFAAPGAHTGFRRRLSAAGDRRGLAGRAERRHAAGAAPLRCR